MKVIFLDVDGVICLDGLGMDDLSLKCLKEIVDVTGAKIVLSSTWRLYDDNMNTLLEEFKAAGIEKPIDVTPDFSVNRLERHVEISEWLARHREVKKFAIIDDWPKAEIQTSSGTFFRTESWEGLTPALSEKVINHLGKEISQNS